jgi:hypothetical protein
MYTYKKKKMLTRRTILRLEAGTKNLALRRKYNKRLRRRRRTTLQGGETLESILTKAVLQYLNNEVPKENFCTFDERKVISYIPDKELRQSLLLPGNDFAFGDYVDCDELHEEWKKAKKEEQSPSSCCCVTASGKRCSRKSVEDSNYCTQHKKAVAANNGKCSKKGISPVC